MASNIIHYAISKRILEQIEVKDVERFLMGTSIVPDISVHEDGSYDQAHFFARTPDHSRKGIDWTLFEEKYRPFFDTDAIYLGYWCHLVQDAMWFHDIVDKLIRIHPRNVRQHYYAKSYEDYKRLNYLLAKEYTFDIPVFSHLNIPITEVRTDLLRTKLDGFYQQFEYTACAKGDLELYTWDIITNYIEKCTTFCIHELRSMLNNRPRTMPSCFFVAS